MSDLFDSAAELLAFTSGRPLSQERAELTHPEPRMPEDGLFSKVSHALEHLENLAFGPRLCDAMFCWEKAAYEFEGRRYCREHFGKPATCAHGRTFPVFCGLCELEELAGDL